MEFLCALLLVHFVHTSSTACSRRLSSRVPNTAPPVQHHPTGELYVHMYICTFARVQRTAPQQRCPVFNVCIRNDKTHTSSNTITTLIHKHVHTIYCIVRNKCESYGCKRTTFGSRSRVSIACVNVCIFCALFLSFALRCAII